MEQENRVGLLAGRRVLVTGVLTRDSIAAHVAATAIAEGAEVILNSFGRTKNLTSRVARQLGITMPILELDVTSDADLAELESKLEAVGGVDGIVHSIGFAPSSLLGGNFLGGSWDDVAVAMRISTWSFAALTSAAGAALHDGGSVVGLDFDASVAWPCYDWMGVAKAGLESACRYMAAQLGERAIRVNLVAAGPVRTVAARSIGGFSAIEDVWNARAPLGWDTRDCTPVAEAVAVLLSPYLSKTTGHILHVDGGFKAVGV